MNNYITLNGKRYKTNSDTWTPPTQQRPVQVKKLWSGKNDVTFGPASIVEWSGDVIAPVVPDGPEYGSVVDLRTAYSLLQPLSFIDHYGVSYTVVLAGSIAERSKTPVWDGASNSFLVPIILVPVP